MSAPYEFEAKVSAVLKAAIAHVDNFREKKKANAYIEPMPEELEAAVDSLRDAAFRAAIDSWHAAVEQGRIPKGVVE